MPFGFLKTEKVNNYQYQSTWCNTYMIFQTGLIFDTIREFLIFQTDDVS
jgi:hypothetical protein